MKIKKIPYNLLLLLLTGGASLIIGFLSFSGILALVPILSFAIASSLFSIAAYEGEVFFRNIKGAFDKLFKSDYLKNNLANKYLLDNFPEVKKGEPDGRHPFFKKYEALLLLLDKFDHKRLDKESSAIKKRIETHLRDMEKWFAIQLFAPENETGLTEYEIELREWLKKSHQQKESQALLLKRQTLFNYVKVCSVLDASFMCLGTTYLLPEAFFKLSPLFATLPYLPALIVPMALVAGAAYGFLIYNAVTDMINNDTLRKWYNKATNRGVFIGVSATVLLILTAALTFCTAGTWWTVVKNTPPLFAWIGRMPNYVMGVINPFIRGSSQFIFYLQNSWETLDQLDNAGNFFRKKGNTIAENDYKLRASENWLQILNPARLVLKFTLTPLRLICFFLHLVTIGVAGDRVPGIPAIFSALLGIICEGFGDGHYFLSDFFHKQKHHHDIKGLLKERFDSDHGHNHSADIPTRVINGIFLPLYALESVLNSWASKWNTDPKDVLSFKQAWNKHYGQAEESVILKKKKIELAKPSPDWQIQQAYFRIQHYIDKHLHNPMLYPELAKEKIGKLQELQRTLRGLKLEAKNTVITLIAEEATKFQKIYPKQLFFEQTNTADFLAALAQRISAPVP